jgi:hypothetical protein
MSGLALEQGKRDSQQQRLGQRVDRLEHTDVLDQGLVPQEAQDKGQEQDINREDHQIVDKILLGTGLENVQHLLLTERKNLG